MDRNIEKNVVRDALVREDYHSHDIISELQKEMISSITGFDFKYDEFQVLDGSDLLAVFRAGVELGQIVGKDEAAREENN